MLCKNSICSAKNQYALEKINMLGKNVEGDIANHHVK